MRVVYGAVPELLRPEVERLTERWRRFVPGWVARLTVSYDDTDTESYCSIQAAYTQRWAGLAIHPAMWSLDMQARDVTFLHEIGHALMAPVDTAVAQIIETRPPKSTAERLYEDAVEGFVNDFAALAWEVDK